MFIDAKSLLGLCFFLVLVGADSWASFVVKFPACCLSDENVHVTSVIPFLFELCWLAIQAFQVSFASLKFHIAWYIIGVLRDFEVPPACDSGTSSILFGWHKSAGHSSLVHSGLGSHREDSGAERAAASHWTLDFCPRVLVPHNQSHEISS